MEQKSYHPLVPEEAKHVMDAQTDRLILDVRTPDEFREGHIEGAYSLPLFHIKRQAEAEIADKETVILVYCQSGQRSKLAAEDLTELGYTNVYDFGGILDWPYEVVQ